MNFDEYVIETIKAYYAEHPQYSAMYQAAIDGLERRINLHGPYPDNANMIRAFRIMLNEPNAVLQDPYIVLRDILDRRLNNE